MILDDSIFGAIHSLAGQSKFLDSLGVFLASYLPYFLVLGFLIFILRQKKFSEKVFTFLFAGLTVILSRGLITETTRFFYNRLRPFAVLNFNPLISAETNNSFPSGHAAFFFGLAAVVFYFNKKLGTWFLVLTLLNGFARIFVGVHWPSDVLGGAIIGVVSFFAIKIMVKNPKITDKVTIG